MKYIDSEKLIADLESIYDNMLERIKIDKDDSDYWAGKADAYRNVIDTITSLQQEKPLTIEKVVEQCKKFGGNPEVIQPEVDLEQFISDFFDKKDAENNGRWSEDDIVEAITKAYELGRTGIYPANQSALRGNPI